MFINYHLTYHILIILFLISDCSRHNQHNNSTPTRPTYTTTGTLMGIQAIHSYPMCRKCDSPSKLQTPTCPKCRHNYDEGDDLPKGFIAEVMVEEEDKDSSDEDTPTTIKLFNTQLKLLVPNMPENADQLSDALTESFPTRVTFTPSPKKDNTLSRFRVL
jgi:hypothetical protein